MQKLSVVALYTEGSLFVRIKNSPESGKVFFILLSADASFRHQFFILLQLVAIPISVLYSNIVIFVIYWLAVDIFVLLYFIYKAVQIFFAVIYLLINTVLSLFKARVIKYKVLALSVSYLSFFSIFYILPSLLNS